MQINICWIFLALCNNGIQGKEMLEHGITRDMFLVACNPNHKEKMIFNPQSNQIRHLVIASFAHLGKNNEVIND